MFVCMNDRMYILLLLYCKTSAGRSDYVGSGSEKKRRKKVHSMPDIAREGLACKNCAQSLAVSKSQAIMVIYLQRTSVA